MTQNASGLPEQEGLIPLPIPVPPSLAGALGYGGRLLVGRLLVINLCGAMAAPLPTPGSRGFWPTCNTLG
jgi:hypothetical protein